MNILIIGYGRMGHEVENIAAGRGHTITGRIDPSGCGDAEKLDPSFLEKSDMVIEFSQPQGVTSNAALYVEYGVSAVVGTTGWLEEKSSVEDIVRKGKIGYLYGSNFSVGAHIFFRLSEILAGLINPFPEYDIMVTEYHHRRKKDSPSGTALTTAAKILAKNNIKDEIVTNRMDGEIKESQLHVASVRGGSIPGIHIVDADSPADTVEIRHTARNRGGLAAGSVYAAEWLHGRTGFFPVDEFMEDILHGGLN